MNLVLRRVCAVAVLLAGISLGLWIVYGAPHEWEGGVRLLRFALGLTSMGMISGSAWLMFPSAEEEEEEPAAGTAGQDTAPAPGPLEG